MAGERGAEGGNVPRVPEQPDEGEAGRHDLPGPGEGWKGEMVLGFAARQGGGGPLIIRPTMWTVLLFFPAYRDGTSEVHMLHMGEVTRDAP